MANSSESDSSSELAVSLDNILISGDGDLAVGFSGTACDRFDISEKPSSFFLTHSHTDHTVNLGSDQFANYLKENNYKLYCSVGTMSYVAHAHPQLIPHTVALPLGKPTTINVIPPPPATPWPSHLRAMNNFLFEPYELTVTAIDANHCHGSVMFLFERSVTVFGDQSDNATIREGVRRALYTGDARLDDAWFGDLQSPKYPLLYDALHNSDGTVKHIDEVYLDATFYRQPTLPSKADSRTKIVELIEEHRDHYTTVLSLRAQYDAEDVLLEIHRRTGLKTLVDSEVYKAYAEDATLLKCITTSDPWAKVIAFVSYKRLSDAEVDHVYELRFPELKRFSGLEKQRRYEYLCGELNRSDTGVLVIRPTTLHFVQYGVWKESDGIVQDYANVTDESNRGLRVLRSAHSSCSELRRFLAYLRPSAVRLTAIPSDGLVEEAERFLIGFSDEASSKCP